MSVPGSCADGAPQPPPLQALSHCPASGWAPQVDVAGDQPGTCRRHPWPREASCRSPLSLGKGLWVLSTCVMRCRSPEDGGAGEGTRAGSWDQGQLKLSCRGIGTKLAEKGSPGASGTAECPGHQQCVCGSPTGDWVQGGGMPRSISPCMCQSLGEEQEATGAARSCPHRGD